MRAGIQPWATISALLVVVTTGLAGVTLAAETGPPLRVGHYSAANGLAGFVLDRLGTPIKLRLDGSEEILALTVEPASRDAVSLKRDDGRYILRIDAGGGMTLFGEKFRDGVEVIMDQSAQPLTIAPAAQAKAEEKAAALARLLKRESGADLKIVLEAPTLAKDSAAWSAMADAVTIVGIALNEVVADTLGREAVAAKLDRVVIRANGNVAIRLDDRALVVEVAPDKPIIGRPSSKRLVSAIGDLL